MSPDASPPRETEAGGDEDGGSRPWIARHPLPTAAGAGALLLVLAAGGACLFVPDVAPLRTAWPDTTAYMRLRMEVARDAGRSFRLRWHPVPLKRMPERLRRAVIRAEDAAFWSHRGVDWTEVRAALEEAWEKKHVPRGASTITQQLARNLYLSPSQTPWRKWRELCITRALERGLPKARILEIYLNVVELGPGVFGVDAAARHYFGVDVAELSGSQAVQLAASLPAPRTQNPATDTPGFRWRVRLIARRLAVVDSLWRAGGDTTDLPPLPRAPSPAAGGSGGPGRLPAPDTVPAGRRGRPETAGAAPDTGAPADSATPGVETLPAGVDTMPPDTLPGRG